MFFGNNIHQDRNSAGKTAQMRFLVTLTEIPRLLVLASTCAGLVLSFVAQMRVDSIVASRLWRADVGSWRDLSGRGSSRGMVMGIWALISTNGTNARRHSYNDTGYVYYGLAKDILAQTS